MDDPFGVAIFCDDIREEVGGKISLIGCYGVDMQFQGVSFPVVLPKFGIFVTARLPIDRATPPIRFLVYFPGDSEDAPSMAFDVPLPEEIQKMPGSIPPRSEPLAPPDTKRMHGVRQHFVLSPAIINTEGFIRVRMIYGDQRFPLGALKVHTVQPPGMLGTPPPPPA
jgi:hypothetical protein